MSIVEKLAQISKVLNVSVHYEYSLSIDKPGETHCSRREHYRLKATGYKVICVPSFEQVMELTIADFTPE